MTHSVAYSLIFSLLCLSLLPSSPRAQQLYLNNAQFNCYANNGSSTRGYACNGPQASCSSYFIFRSQPGFQTPDEIGSLLDSSSAEIAEINQVAQNSTIPVDSPVVVPTHCSCSGEFYQHNASYAIPSIGSTYLTIANDTYQGLTTCQALIAQNPQADSRALTIGLPLSVPLRCACPSKDQINSGVKFLLSYLVTWGDDFDNIATRFDIDSESVVNANDLSSDSVIYPFTTLLIPLKGSPTVITASKTPSTPLQPTTTSNPSDVRGSDKKWVFVGVGTGVGFLVPSAVFMVWLLDRFRRRALKGRQSRREGNLENPEEFGEALEIWSASSSSSSREWSEA